MCAHEEASFYRDNTIFHRRATTSLSENAVARPVLIGLSWARFENIFNFAVVFHTLSTLKRFFAFERNLNTFGIFGSLLVIFVVICPLSLTHYCV